MINRILATPKVRKFARELGADISNLKGSERNGRITEEDVKNFIKNSKKSIPVKETQKPEPKKNLVDHSEFGEIEIVEMPRVKKLAAPLLSESWRTIPHVTHHDEADVTELENFRKNLKDGYTGEQKKITPLAFIIKALVKSMMKYPIFNSSIKDEENYQIILKKYFHIGIAVDTPHGLMVPKIRDADKFKISDLSQKLKEVSDKCRNLKIDKKEFQGGSITITSLGGIGGTFFTPIINPPEVAILGIGKIFQKDKSDKLILPLSLSYDHRIINGADAARFCNEIKENLGKNFAYNLSI